MLRRKEYGEQQRKGWVETRTKVTSKLSVKWIRFSDIREATGLGAARATQTH